MKKNSVKILFVLIPLLIVSYLFFVNRIIISIRLNELQKYLEDTDANEGNIDNIALIATYEIHKKIYEERMSQDEADTAEHKLDSLSLPLHSPGIIYGGINTILTLPAVSLINFNRRMLGKPPVNYEKNNDLAYRELDQAFYYEKNFMFKRAIPLYSRALESNIFNERYRSSILLRQGYCYALSGNNDKAMSNYSKVIKDYSQESSAITASILIRYLEGFRMARERVLLNESDPLLKSRMLVNLLAYEQALKIIEDTETKATSKDIPSLQYFKAQCYSGLGQPEKAVENYLSVIISSPSSPYAKYSNRKLYKIGKAAGGNNEILAVSRKINARLNDPVLTDLITTEKDSDSNRTVSSDPIKIKVPEKLSGKVAEMTSELKAPADVILVIVTNDGNTFKGRLIQKSSTHVSIQTSIGRVDVNKDRITKISELK